MNQSVEQRLKEIEEVTPPKQSCECPDCETIRFLLTLCKKQRGALNEAAQSFAGSVLLHGQNVKQLDGSVKWELIQTHDGKVYSKILSALDFDPSEDASGGGA